MVAVELDQRRPEAEPRSWTFREYVDEHGVNQVAEEIDALPADVREKVRAGLHARVHVLQALPDVFDWRGAELLRNPRDGVLEINLDHENGRYAALAFQGPADDEITVLAVVRLRTGRVSRTHRQIARERMRTVSAAASRVRYALR